MIFDFSGMKLPKMYDGVAEKHSLSVWGETWERIPDDVELADFSVEELQKLNFDGGYVALYEDKSSGNSVIFRSHIDSFALYYCEKDGVLYFSDDYFSCLSHFDTVTWNLDSIADYFEGAWNNICKYNRTPFNEISKLDAWDYLVVHADGSKTFGNWNLLKREKYYTEKTLDVFKKDFFEAIDYYLKKVHDKTNGKVALSLSAGTDSNTLAAQWCQLYPESPAIFFTSKINDVTDESKIASSMQKCVTAPIQYVPIKTETGNFVERLHTYMQTHVPPRFINELSEIEFISTLKEEGVTPLNVNGMGADGRFGEFGNEYIYLVREYLAKCKFIKARKTFAAIQNSFNYTNRRGGVLQFLLFAARFYARIILAPVARIKNAKMRNAFLQDGAGRRLLKTALPPFGSQNVRSHKDALLYAGQEGAGRCVADIYRQVGLEVCYPYMGYRLYELSAKCDPYIFSIGENKHCLRYAIKDLLPKEILENKKKTGNPGVTLAKLLKSGNNAACIADYLAGHESVLVDRNALLSAINEKTFDRNDFLAFSLLMFENMLKEERNITVLV